MHRIPNNRFLYKCKLKSHNICDFCSMCLDANKHTIYECHVIQKFWMEVKHCYINTYLCQPINFELSYEKK